MKVTHWGPTPAWPILDQAISLGFDLTDPIDPRKIPDKEVALEAADFAE